MSAIRGSAEGMEIAISGADPFIAGPTVELPADASPQTQYLLELKLKSEQGGMVELFYFPAGGHAAAGRSVARALRRATGKWWRMALPTLERRTAFRIDPPGTGGTRLIASMSLRQAQRP